METSSSSSSYALAYEQSFGFFDDIRDEDWRRFQKIHMYAFPNHVSQPLPVQPVERAPGWYAGNFQEEFHCTSLS